MRGYIGEGEGALRSSFQEAKRLAPSILFIDEFQAAFSAQGQGGRSTLSTTLASCLDDLCLWNTHAGVNALVTVMAATNEPWAISSSFLRAGRLEKTLFVGPLDGGGRQSMFRDYFSRNEDFKESKVEALIKGSEGYTGADMDLLFRKADNLLFTRSSGSVDVVINSLSDVMERSMRASVGADELNTYERWRLRKI